MNSIEFPKVPRRVVTGHKNGVSTIVEDKTVSQVLRNDDGFIISDPWATDSMPVDLSQSAEMFNEFFPKWHPNGTLFRYVHIPPHSVGQMHTTETLDYIIILSGELYLVMEDTETLLKPGDIVIQRATQHGWDNRSDKPCIQLAIILDAKSCQNE